MTCGAVIFDVGGVLAHASTGQFAAAFFGTHDENGSHPWHRLERGELTMAQAVPLLDLPPGRARPPRPYTLDEGYLELVEQLAEAGVKLALCTNTTREGAALWQGLYPWAEIFEVIVRSCDIGARKPDVRMVRTALERLGAEPRETVFVDDLPINRESASTLGVIAIDGGRPEGIARIRELTGIAPGAPRRVVGYRGPRRPTVQSRADQLLVEVLFTEQHRDDPYPPLRELRETSPLHQLRGSPTWYATRYDDCRRLLHAADSEDRTEGTAVDFATGDPVFAPPSALAFVDPPRHEPIRRLLDAAFARRLSGWRPWLRDLATEVTGKARSGGGPVDAVEALSYPMATRAVCELVGVPADARDAVRALMRDASGIFEPAVSPARMYDAVTAIVDVNERLADLGDTQDGLLRDLLHAAREAGDVAEDDAIASVAVLLFAGVETVAHFLSITLHLLSAHPDQYALLAATPELASAAAKECWRYHSPVQARTRVVGQDLDLPLAAGQRVPAAAPIVTMLGAANRDPAAFRDPDRFDITRDGPEPLPFGGGIHDRIAGELALSQATALLESLIEAGVRRIAPVRASWRSAVVLRGLDVLELELR